VKVVGLVPKHILLQMLATVRRRVEQWLWSLGVRSSARSGATTYRQL